MSINTNTLSKQQIINQAINFHLEGHISKAAKLYQYFISQGFEDHRVFSNYGVILKNLRKLKEAEFSYRKAIQLNPYIAEAHYNLGIILSDLGNIKEAELSYRKAIHLNPDLAEAHYNLGIILSDLGNIKEAELSTLQAIKLNPNYAKGYYALSLFQSSDNIKIWKYKLFSKNILNNNSEKDQIDIFFARANILHKEKNYKESAKCLNLSNKFKLDINPSNAEKIFNKSKLLLIEANQEKIYRTDLKKYPESIFIVGMPRSGSTLIESIISMNNNVDDLGEVNILEEAFLEWKKTERVSNLSKIYWKTINKNKDESKITTNKWLYNYQYTGVISKHISNAKIIHCFRHPLDNILSIYRAHFAKGNEYASSLVDCTRVYIDQEDLMTKYKNRFRSKIYDLNYDSLVSNPNKEIKSLIDWLGWKWDDSYLKPHLNPRSILTRSNIEVRSPINSSSIGGWKNYKEMLKPAIEILSQTDRYQYLV